MYRQLNLSVTWRQKWQRCFLRPLWKQICYHVWSAQNSDQHIVRRNVNHYSCWGICTKTQHGSQKRDLNPSRIPYHVSTIAYVLVFDEEGVFVALVSHWFWTARSVKLAAKVTQQNPSADKTNILIVKGNLYEYPNYKDQKDQNISSSSPGRAGISFIIVKGSYKMSETSSLFSLRISPEKVPCLFFLKDDLKEIFKNPFNHKVSMYYFSHFLIRGGNERIWEYGQYYCLWTSLPCWDFIIISRSLTFQSLRLCLNGSLKTMFILIIFEYLWHCTWCLVIDSCVGASRA